MAFTKSSWARSYKFTLNLEHPGWLQKFQQPIRALKPAQHHFKPEIILLKLGSSFQLMFVENIHCRDVIIVKYTLQFTLQSQTLQQCASLLLCFVPRYVKMTCSLKTIF